MILPEANVLSYNWLDIFYDFSKNFGSRILNEPSSVNGLGSASGLITSELVILPEANNFSWEGLDIGDRTHNLNYVQALGTWNGRVY